jgi:hypothetical protein
MASKEHVGFTIPKKILWFLSTLAWNGQLAFIAPIMEVYFNP